MALNIKNESCSEIEIFNGHSIKQCFNKTLGRWRISIPNGSGLCSIFGNVKSIPRSHYVFCRTTGLDGIKSGYCIHHIDHDKTNDSFENLKLMTIVEHDEYHKNHRKIHPRKPPFLGRRHKQETLEKMSEIARLRGNNGVWGGAKSNHFKSTIDLLSEKSSGKGNSQYRHDLNTNDILEFYDLSCSISETAKKFGCSCQAVRSRIDGRSQPNSDINWKELDDDELFRLFNSTNKNLSQLALKIGAPQTSLWRKLKRIGDNRV